MKPTLLKILDETKPQTHEPVCTNRDCEVYGNKPVCYMIFCDTCEEYDNETPE